MSGSSTGQRGTAGADGTPECGRPSRGVASHSVGTIPDGLYIEDLRAAHAAALELARETPVLTAKSLSERLGGTIALKAENLQRTGSFKLRGALNKLATLPPGTTGVVGGSAGNHGQSLAYAARARGVACTIHMPARAAVSKVAAVRAFGGEVILDGESVDDCVATARAGAEEGGRVFVH